MTQYDPKDNGPQRQLRPIEKTQESVNPEPSTCKFSLSPADSWKGWLVAILLTTGVSLVTHLDFQFELKGHGTVNATGTVQPCHPRQQ